MLGRSRPRSHRRLSRASAARCSSGVELHHPALPGIRVQHRADLPRAAGRLPGRARCRSCSATARVGESKISLPIAIEALWLVPVLRFPWLARRWPARKAPLARPAGRARVDPGGSVGPARRWMTEQPGRARPSRATSRTLISRLRTKYGRPASWRSAFDHARRARRAAARRYSASDPRAPDVAPGEREQQQPQLGEHHADRVEGVVDQHRARRRPRARPSRRCPGSAGR